MQTLELNVSSIKLRKLIVKVKKLLARKPANLTAIKSAVENLLYFLTTPEGKTDQNCKTTDMFFCLAQDEGITWKHLPEDLQSILDDISMCLHDAIEDPKTAKNFESTPEQLLARVKKLKY